MRDMTGQAFKWAWKESASGRWWSVRGAQCEITIEPRPHYCDRGNWIAKLHPSGELARDIDGADGWPRYYFDIERAKAECEAWLVKRGQT